MDQFISKEVLDILSYHSTLGRSLKQISLRKTPLPMILEDIEKYRASYIDTIFQENLIGSRFKSEDSIRSRTINEARCLPGTLEALRAEGVQIVILDDPDIYSEYAPYEYIEDMKEFIEKYYLDLSLNSKFNARDTFGSHDDSDHIYNTPRAYDIERYFNPHTFNHQPFDDDIPWSQVPEKKITVEDVKYVLSLHFQGTDFDPYKTYGDLSKKGMYRPIGINRNDFLSVIQLRNDVPKSFQAIEWIAYASNVFNALVPFYGSISETPDYLSNTTDTVSTDNFYWSSRLIAAMADASYKKSSIHIERYQKNVMAKGHHLINTYDELLQKENDLNKQLQLKHQANQEIADMLKEETNKTISLVLNELSLSMKNKFERSDA